MSELDEVAERKRRRAERMTATVLRPGDAPPREPATTGIEALRLATELSAMAFTVAGWPATRVPHAEWPISRRSLHETR